MESKTQPVPVDLERLSQIAEKAMTDRGMNPSIPAEALAQAAAIHSPAPLLQCKDLRKFLWISIDPEESEDLDQITYAEEIGNDQIRIYVAIIDVDALVPKDSPIDLYAQDNTTTVYTPIRIFPMLPLNLSHHFTSFLQDQERRAVVVSFIVEKDGALGHYEIAEASVRNHAKLSYQTVGEWLSVAATTDVQTQVKLQNTAAQKIRRFRHAAGALTLQTVETEPKIVGNKLIEIRETSKNRAQLLIEDFMIAANTLTTAYLVQHKFPSLRRIVKEPADWLRIVSIARQYGAKLPRRPSAGALESFLLSRKSADPHHYPELCLTVIKLLGRGEYAVTLPGQKPIGHFALALRDYSHATAPNRRFPDLLTQRMIKAALNAQENPYSVRDLLFLAPRCTQKQDDAEKVERRMKKSAAALFLSSSIGSLYNAIITGSGPKGVWVRLLHPPIEGRIVKDGRRLQVGDRLKVKLVSVNVEQGYIDFIPCLDH